MVVPDGSTGPLAGSRVPELAGLGSAPHAARCRPASAPVVHVERPPVRELRLGPAGAADTVRRGRRSVSARTELEPPGRRGPLLRHLRLLHDTYARAYGKYVAVAALEQHFSAALLDGLGPARLSAQDDRDGRHRGTAVLGEPGAAAAAVPRDRVRRAGRADVRVRRRGR
ncbi:hypothetical protein [Streptomyces rhizosphaerihabitans]|uniref:hypothetical protein n=1 Tax=Streptomyces rhizosphaerihabitans TaxID=1266770 RepID=UPI0021C0C9EC|nr:hypothetical protein [Streptomyces rhizosphaerihabitans]MCT9011455.1 hypothetical protein [Streptomyces rhizosphaerihabitans]